MVEERKVSFKVHGFTPDTLPVARLAEYLKDISALFGDAGAHLIDIKEGSTYLAFLLDVESEAYVRDRLAVADSADAPEDLSRAFQALNGELRRDQTYG